jgi:glycosyltransferase involved in cell wall biosynthesis
VFDELSRLLDGDLHVVYCTGREPGRQWDLPRIRHEHTILERESRGVRHNHPSIVPVLARLDPRVVVTAGFSPTFLYAYYWSALRGRQHVAFTDGTSECEATLGPLHRAARRVVYGASSAFLGASDRSLALYRSYGVDESRLFKTVLAVDAARFEAADAAAAKEFDLVFSGRLVPEKLPGFFLDVCTAVARRRSALRALVLGDGPLRGFLEGKARAERLAVTFAGFCRQDELPARYAAGRVMLFPTRGDTWGIVAAEALAAGLPVITCAAAGVAGELVVHDRTGYVLPLDPDLWADCALALLEDEGTRARLGAEGATRARAYDFGTAARGMLSAIRRASE